MKEIISAVDSFKFQLFCYCLIMVVVATIGTTGLLTYWVYFPFSLPIFTLVVAWVCVLIVCAYTVSVCCLRTEKEVEMAARSERAIQNILNQLKEMENESS